MSTRLLSLAVIGMHVCGVIAQSPDTNRYLEQIKNDQESDAVTTQVVSEARKPEGMDDYSWGRARKAHKLQMAENADILFYGRVMDPDRRPISGAVVRGKVSAYDGGFLKVFMTTDNDRKILDWTVTTDADGRFVVSNMKGLSLKVTSIEKAEYFAPPSETIYLMSGRAYGNHVHHANSEHPVDYVIWPHSVAAADGDLVRKSIRVYGRANDDTSRFDIVSGKHVANENDHYDLSVSINVPETTAERRIKHDWSLIITAAPDCGLAQTSESYAYRAPAEGYVDQITVDVSKSSPDWDERRRLKVYVKGQGGKVYAAVSLSVYSYHDGEVLIEVESVANITGSVNLMPPP